MTNASHFLEDSFKYMDLIPITNRMSISRAFIPLFIVTSGILKMETIPVWAKTRFCWVIWVFVVLASIDWIKPEGMKWMLASDGGSGSKIDDLKRRDCRIVDWAGWHLTSYATVVTLFDMLPISIRFVDKSNAGNMIRSLFVSASFSYLSGLRLLLLLWITSSSVVFWSAMMSSGGRSIFMSAVHTLFFCDVL